MELFDHLHHSTVAGVADQPGVIRIDEGGALAAVGQVDRQADGLVRPGRDQHIGDLAPQAGLGRRDPEVRRGGPGAGFDAGQVAIDGPVDLVGEKIEGTGQRHQHQEGQDQQAGVEMPAPDGAEGTGEGSGSRVVGHGKTPSRRACRPAPVVGSVGQAKADEGRTALTGEEDRGRGGPCIGDGGEFADIALVRQVAGVEIDGRA